MLNHHTLLDLVINRSLSAHVHSAISTYNVLAGRVGYMGMVPEASRDTPFIEHHNATASGRRLIIPQGAELIVPGSSRFSGEMVAAEDGSWRRTEPYMRTRHGTAIVHTIGSLVNRGAYVGSQSGVTSYEGLSFQLMRAANDPKAYAILIDTSSPGGESMGNDEIARQIMEIRKIKPVFGIANAMACSAGYCILAACTEAYGTPSSLIGSIGCILLHLDKTEQAKNEGVVPTIIHAGAHKADGHAYNSLTPQALAELKAGVNSYYELFLKTVGAGRGPALTAKKARETEARTFVGKEAKAIGLIDDLATFDQVLGVADSIGRRKNSRSSRSTSRGSEMSSLVSQMYGTQNEAPEGAPQSIYIDGRYYVPIASAPAQPQPAPQPAPQPHAAAPQPAPQPAPAPPASPQNYDRVQRAMALCQTRPDLLSSTLSLLNAYPALSAENALLHAAASAEAARVPQMTQQPAVAPPQPAPAYPQQPVAAGPMPPAPPGYQYVQAPSGHLYLAANPPAQPGLPDRNPVAHLAAQVAATGVGSVPAGLGVSPAGVPQGAGFPGAAPGAAAPVRDGYLPGDVPGSVTLEKAPWQSHIAAANGRISSFEKSYQGNHEDTANAA